MRHVNRLGVLAASIGVVILAAIAVVGTSWGWHTVQATSYTFSPCPGLTVTSSVTTGIWNCPMEPATTRGSNVTLVVGEFVTISGTWATGYGTFGCVPTTGQSSCAVPQLASLQDYLYTNIGRGMWFVVKWKNSSAVQLANGQRVTISGSLKEIAYPSNPGSTYPIYHLNNETNTIAGSNLVEPQPVYEITDAVLG